MAGTFFHSFGQAPIFEPDEVFCLHFFLVVLISYFKNLEGAQRIENNLIFAIKGTINFYIRVAVVKSEILFSKLSYEQTFI